MMNITVIHTMTGGLLSITDETIRDLMCCAFEGGSNYWYAGMEKGKPSTEPVSEELQKEWPWPYLLPTTGGSVTFSDAYEAEDGKVVTYTLDGEAIKRGLSVMAKDFHNRFADIVEEDMDANTGDVFLQCCIFGDVIYG